RGPSRDELEALVRPVRAPDLGGRTSVGENDVRSEVVRATDERRPDAVRADRDALRLELADLVDREPARGDDLHVLEAVVVERVADLPDRPVVHARRRR